MPGMTCSFLHTVTMALLVLLGASLVVPFARAQGNTTCKDPTVTWYNNPDGLNPCEMYGRLRAICDQGYSVPTMDRALPPDTCQSQLPICCCNSVAFNIAMMCLQCQQGVGTGRRPDIGIDAPPETMQKYFSGCNTGPIGELPAQVQAGVCRTGLKLMPYQYNPHWSDGAWFLEYTRGVANLQVAAGELDTGKCPNNPATSTPSPSSTPQPSGTRGGASGTPNPSKPAEKDQVSPALIGGVVAGVIAILIMLAVIAWLVLRERRRRAVAGEHPAKWSGPASQPGFPSMGTVGPASYHSYALRSESTAPSVPSRVAPASSASGTQPAPSQQVAAWVGASGQGVTTSTSAYRSATGKGGVRADAAPVSRADEFDASPPRYDEGSSPHPGMGWSSTGFRAADGSVEAGRTSRSMSPDAHMSVTDSSAASRIGRALSPPSR